jgi:uncharacterized protein YprB with RNaseH-like and TPR domain
MLESTFRILPGIGPSRERELWAKGFVRWGDLPAEGAILSPRIDDRLRAAVAEARELWARGDVEALAARLPLSVRWRLWPAFEARTCFLDIECDGRGETVTVVGVFDAEGPHAFVHGVNLEVAALNEVLARSAIVVTFNGTSFDLPVLRRAFPEIALPPVHVDLLHLWRRLGERGGLKTLEKRMGLPRPGTVEGLDGFAAVRLWQRWELDRDGEALRRIVEYNLYDCIQLRPLLDVARNRAVEHLGLPLPRREVFSRGDVLYDVSRILLSLPGGAGGR